MAETTPAYTTYKVIITGIQEETPGVKTFTLAAQDGSIIPYKAGQFLTFLFHNYHQEDRRSYSISTSPAMDAPLAITAKRVQNGAYSRLLIDRASVGDVLETTGAAGLFTLPENIAQYEQLFFLAAGIGITPIYSLIQTALRTSAAHIVLIYSNRTIDDTVFYNELQDLVQQYPGRLQIEFLFSSSFNLSRARLSKWLLPVLLKEYGKVDKDRQLFYLCGPFSYMRMVVIGLQEQGIADEQIKKENFDTSRPVRKAEPPDKADHTITVHFNKQQYQFPVSYPDTILQAAKKQGIQLPYSCEAGRCGSCAALCKSGEVWLSYNEVLTNADIAAGRILTCVGHPINGDVTLEL